MRCLGMSLRCFVLRECAVLRAIAITLLYIKRTIITNCHYSSRSAECSSESQLDEVEAYRERIVTVGTDGGLCIGTDGVPHLSGHAGAIDERCVRRGELVAVRGHTGMEHLSHLRIGACGVRSIRFSCDEERIGFGIASIRIESNHHVHQH